LSFLLFCIFLPTFCFVFLIIFQKISSIETSTIMSFTMQTVRRLALRSSIAMRSAHAQHVARFHSVRAARSQVPAVAPEASKSMYFGSIFFKLVIVIMDS
jgi:hypothetical protein